jgi:hypothetical protein
MKHCAQVGVKQKLLIKNFTNFKIFYQTTILDMSRYANLIGLLAFLTLLHIVIGNEEVEPETVDEDILAKLADHKPPE